LNRYRICVYAISKNEEAFVDRWMDSVGEADLVVVADTGSTDETVKRLRARGAVVYEEAIVPWRFDAARNAALGHVPEDVDICVSNDLDEVFEPGWRQKLEAAWLPEHTRARYLFTWSYRADGTPEKQFPMEKIHRRSGYRWIHPVHEVLEYSGEGGENKVFVDGLVLNHHPDPAKPRAQYLPLLELSAAENPQDAQTAFWLGREYLYNLMHEQCIRTLKGYLNLPGARWGEERSAAMRFIAESSLARGDAAEARSWLFRAIAECQEVREPYHAMALTANRERNWPLLYAMVKKALSIEQPSGSYLTEPACWGAGFYDLGSIAAYHLGLLEEAYAYALLACGKAPGDNRLAANLNFFAERLVERAKGQEHGTL
jgi:glycosyltransferase involved in cell wall biosynthesis